MLVPHRTALPLGPLALIPLLVGVPVQERTCDEPCRGPAATGDEALAAAASRDDGQDEEPADWRDRSNPERRKVWDALEGKPAPTLDGLVDWTQAAGRSWADLRGEVVLIDFWATWCPPCREGLPKVQALHAQHAEAGLVALGVHAPRGREKMAEFVAREGLGYAFAADPDGEVYAAYGVQFIPTYMVVDRRGVLRVAGANPAKLGEIVTTLLAEPVPDAEDAPVPNWPEVVAKELYAERDLRGDPAPELVFGEWLTAAPELEGKAVLIDFWATWCGPCRRAIPELNELHERFGEDLAVIGLSKEDPAVVRAFAEDTPMHYALACDPSGALSDAIGVKGIPHVLLLSSDGIVRWQGFPFAAEDPLTPAVVQRVLDSDPGVAARRRARAEAERQQEDEPPTPEDEDGDEGGSLARLRHLAQG